MNLAQIPHQALRGWNRFWFESDGRAQMALMRKGLGLILFVAYLIRSLDLSLLYSNDGIAPLSVLPEVLDLRYRYSLFYVFTSTAALWIFNGIYLASFVGLVLGLLPRACAIIALVIHISFLHRNLGASYGVDLVSVFFLFFLALADHRPASLVLAKPDFRSQLGSVAWRLAQIQLCLIYGYAGLHKLKGNSWWQGEAMWATLANSQMAPLDFSYLAYVPYLLILLTWFTLFWEIYFPVLIWVRPVKYWLLGFGTLFHLGISVGLGIPFFGGMMVMLYPIYFERNDAMHWNQGLKKWVPALN